VYGLRASAKTHRAKTHRAIDPSIDSSSHDHDPGRWLLIDSSSSRIQKSWGLELEMGIGNGNGNSEKVSHMQSRDLQNPIIAISQSVMLVTSHALFPYFLLFV